jgi:hypothetical protein
MQSAISLPRSEGKTESAVQGGNLSGTVAERASLNFRLRPLTGTLFMIQLHPSQTISHGLFKGIVNRSQHVSSVEPWKC